MKSYFKNLLTVYTTTNVVGIKSPLVAIVHVLLIILVWCSFLASLHLDIRKVYQKHCPVHGVVLSKVKGFASTENLTDEELNVPLPDLYRRTWDPADIVYPASGGEGETGSFAIVTNLLITPNQTLSTCADGPMSKCKDDRECQEGYWSPGTNGVHTGRCLKREGSCEIRGWCPIEKGGLPRNGEKALLEDVQDFTVLLKNPVEFPGCSDPEMRNIPSEITKDYLRKCRYNRKSDPMCPIFRIGDIVTWSGDNFTKVAIRGGVFRIKILWDCDLDFGKTVHDCRPNYEFLRVDDREAGIFNGWNFRSADFYAEDRRTLRKQFSLKILVDLEGEGRKFDFFQLIIKIGAMIGLFSIASLVCNTLVYILSKMEKQTCVGKLSGTFQGQKATDDDLEAAEKSAKLEAVIVNEKEAKKVEKSKPPENNEDLRRRESDDKVLEQYTNKGYRDSLVSLPTVRFKSFSE